MEIRILFLKVVYIIMLLLSAGVGYAQTGLCEKMSKRGADSSEIGVVGWSFVLNLVVFGYLLVKIILT